MAGKIENLVKLLKDAHEENRQLHYYATEACDSNITREIMPVTPFIFELFIYNSLYDIDWRKSLSESEIVNHSIQMREGEKQKSLEVFLRPICEADESLVHSAFGKLAGIELSGNWTLVQPDNRIDIERGKQFFAQLRKIGVR